METPADSSAEEPRKPRPLVHLLSAGIVALLLGALDGYLAATREGVGELTDEASSATIMLAVALILPLGMIGGLVIGGQITFWEESSTPSKSTTAVTSGSPTYR